MFLELTFTDVDSLRDYLEHYSVSTVYGKTLWRELFVSRDNDGYPFIWYSPLTKEYHIDVQVEGRTDAYGRLPRFKWDKLNKDAMVVWWDSKNLYTENRMRIRTFEYNWCWSDEAIRHLILYGHIHEELSPLYECDDSINITTIKIYEANKYREYIPMFIQPSTSNSTLFELSFQSITDLEWYLCNNEKDLRKTIVMHVDTDRTCHSYRYPLVIHRKPLYDGQPDTYLIDIYAEDEKDLDIPSGWNIEVHKVETKGHYFGVPSPRWLLKTDTYGFFPMQEGQYKWRFYKPDWNTIRYKEELDQFLKQAEKELNDKYIKNGIVMGSDINEALGLDSHTWKFDPDLVVTKDFKSDPECSKSYMLCARGNGKSLRQLKEAFERYMSTGDPIVAIDRKISIHDMYPTKPILKFDDTDVTAMVELYKVYNSNLRAKELKELKERMNIMFGVDLNRIPEIKDVIFNNPATIVFWADGTKTVVKRQKGDRFDKEKGLAMAIVKKLYGNKARYNDLFKKWIKEDK